MGLFNLSLKKRGTKNTPPPSPNGSFVSTFSDHRHGGRRSALSSPNVVSHEGDSYFGSTIMSPPENLIPTVKLNVLLDPLPQKLNGTAWAARGVEKDLIEIEIPEDADVNEITRIVQAELGVTDELALNCYKVALPIEAYRQAKTYTTRYSLPVHLISQFPSYNLFDARQLAASQASAHLSKVHDTPAYCTSLFSAEEDAISRSTYIKDWWPSSEDIRKSEIQVLVRLSQPEQDMQPGLTLLAHFAKPSTSTNPARQGHSRANSTCSSPMLGGAGETPYPPVAVELSRDSTLSEIKASLLEADGRNVKSLDKIVLWRVDMSAKEMLNCEQFGGLKTGEMPWPYPPNAPEPVAMNDPKLRLRDIFPHHRSNPNLVSLFVYIVPSAQKVLARRRETVTETTGERDIPVFSYPMKDLPLPIIPGRPLLVQRQSSSGILSPIIINTEPPRSMTSPDLRTYSRNRRGATSSPSSSVSRDPSPSSLAVRRGLHLKVVPEGLLPSPMMGLGIDMGRPSLEKSHHPLREDSTEDVPNLEKDTLSDEDDSILTQTTSNGWDTPLPSTPKLEESAILFPVDQFGKLTVNNNKAFKSISGASTFPRALRRR